MSIDLELEKIANGMHDLVIKDFDLQLVRDVDHIRQNLKIRLGFFFEEWFLDSTAGIRYIDFVFVANPNVELIAGIMKTTIQETPGVNSLLSYIQDLDRKNRTLNITFEVDTDFGPIEISETVGA